jgi:two-component system NtrC family response regulator
MTHIHAVENNAGNRDLKSPGYEPAAALGLIGSCAAMRRVYSSVAHAGRTESIVLIEGETGTGKEVVARAIHASSARATHGFVAVNCAAIPDELLESELFGSERGAFTGAVSRPGRFEQARGGTLFLDEIGELSRPAQARLLRVLEHRVVQRLGAVSEIPLDARIVAATNVNLAAVVRQGLFRADLMYRLRQLSLHLPPLRDRGGDIVELIAFLLPRACAAAVVEVKTLSDAALEDLRRYSWPGNIRELQHVLLQAAARASGPMIDRVDLGLPLDDAASAFVIPSRSPALGLIEATAQLKAQVERQWIVDALEQSRTLTEAARALHIDPKTLYEKMAAYSLDRPQRLINVRSLAS